MSQQPPSSGDGQESSEQRSTPPPRPEGGKAVIDEWKPLETTAPKRGEVPEELLKPGMEGGLASLYKKQPVINPKVQAEFLKLLAKKGGRKPPGAEFEVEGEGQAPKEKTE